MRCGDCAEFKACSWTSSVTEERDSCIFDPPQYHEREKDIEIFKQSVERMREFILSSPKKFSAVSFDMPKSTKMEIMVLDESQHQGDVNVICAYAFHDNSWHTTPLCNIIRMAVSLFGEELRIRLHE